ncbi:LysR family transcriptional regulator [Aeromonas hydrophila]|uniref:LysR family transcriptional regulator n=1 Tax=Aeromonas hydrophila TaxID=644 RepID=A0AAX3P484_AERHY|nr:MULTISPECIES: LysR family transcriptional regulator [Aeromonas]GKQ61721.1 LysR family transcriptional regulator [Aeromonas caviae]HDT5861114.1 LysR family transcriptional regulator [Aeromonas hydrophila subsp. hydrophila]MCO4116678.1 LysR family transcriptional regulator [Aeromonas hydrophila]MCR3904465.1 LysR family transcriptional regulator [Aeromonas hydrophila]MCV9384425.1 LysR family transcriptional regulator [Aeromonas hydrophila]
MNPSLEQLKTLLVAAQAGSFSAAARQLGKAQSVVSTAIANLEIDLGLELFDRSGRYPVLTEAGTRISQEASILLAQSERLQAIAGELATGVESRLTLAIDDDSHLPWLGSLLEEFATRYPTVELELLFPLMEDVTELLKSGRAQLGISYQQVALQRGIVTRTLGKVVMPLVVSPEHPLAHRGLVQEVDLQGARQLVATGRREGPERQRFRIASQVWWVEGDLGVLELVKRGLGWGVVPDFLLHRPLARGEVVVLKPDFITQPELALELQWHRARPLGQAGRWLKEALLARAR